MYSSLEVFYDGDCPFCKNYAMFHRAKKFAINITLTNMRELSDDHHFPSGMKMSDGVIFKTIDGETGSIQFLQGALAMSFMAKLDDRSNLISLISRPLRNPALAIFLFPFFKFFRRISLLVMGKKSVLADP